MIKIMQVLLNNSLRCAGNFLFAIEEASSVLYQTFFALAKGFSAIVEAVSIQNGTGLKL